jgi:hypothetical protein
MNRREFLLLRKDDDGVAELSGEQLYMRYVDSTMDGTARQFFQNVEQSLSAVKSLRLTDAAWLASEELAPLQTILEAFRARGGTFLEPGE